MDESLSRATRKDFGRPSLNKCFFVCKKERNIYKKLNLSFSSIISLEFKIFFTNALLGVPYPMIIRVLLLHLPE